MHTPTTQTTTSIVNKIFEHLKPLGFILSALLLTLSSHMHASTLDDEKAIETVGVQGLKICHQHEWRNLSVQLEYEMDIGSGETHVQALKKEIRRFLEEYSQPDDFWEVMNTNLVHTLSEAFPHIVSMKSTLSLDPDTTLHFPRESIVQYSREEEALKESFRFTKLDYSICQETFQTLNLHVEWDMKENPLPFDYPDYQWIEAEMNTFFKAHPISFSKWQTLKPELHAHLLEHFPSLNRVDVGVSIVD